MFSFMQAFFAVFSNKFNRGVQTDLPIHNRGVENFHISGNLMSFIPFTITEELSNLFRFIFQFIQNFSFLVREQLARDNSLKITFLI